MDALPAVDEEQAALLRHRRDELIHYAAWSVRKIALGFLATKSLFHSSDIVKRKHFLEECTSRDPAMNFEVKE